jgi:hypothetical protein
MSEVEFREWYRQTLNQSRLSDAEFRELVRVSVMSQQLYNYLADRMSTTVEQVHLWDIVIQDETIANDVKTRIDNGEDFSTIAKELSTDSNTSEQGGDMGWVPLDILDSALKYTAQDLEIGKVSYPTLLSTASQSSSSDSSQIGPFYLLMVTEKDPARPVTDPTYINSLKGLLIQNWITAQMNDKSNKIELHGRGASGGYDSTTNAWILYQMERLKRSYGIQDTTTTSTTTNPVTGQ